MNREGDSGASRHVRKKRKKEKKRMKRRVRKLGRFIAPYLPWSHCPSGNKLERLLYVALTCQKCLACTVSAAKGQLAVSSPLLLLTTMQTPSTRISAQFETRQQIGIQGSIRLVLSA